MNDQLISKISRQKIQIFKKTVQKKVRKTMETLDLNFVNTTGFNVNNTLDDDEVTIVEQQNKNQIQTFDLTNDAHKIVEEDEEESVFHKPKTPIQSKTKSTLMNTSTKKQKEMLFDDDWLLKSIHDNNNQSNGKEKQNRRESIEFVDSTPAPNLKRKKVKIATPENTKATTKSKSNASRKEIIDLVSPNSKSKTATTTTSKSTNTNTKTTNTKTIDKENELQSRLMGFMDDPTDTLFGVKAKSMYTDFKSKYNWTSLLALKGNRKTNNVWLLAMFDRIHLIVLIYICLFFFFGNTGSTFATFKKHPQK